MKRLYPVLCFILLTTFSTTTYATTYTAVASGNYSSNSTWQAGVAPNDTLFNDTDTIVVPTGITVTIDVNANVWKGTISLEGTLTSLAPQYFLMGGVLDGTGSITADSLVWYANTAGFTGTINTRALHAKAFQMKTAFTVNISELLYLGASSPYTFDNGNVVLGSGAVIVKFGWGPIIGTGLDLTNIYDVVYTGGMSHLSSEWYGSGLRNITLDYTTLFMPTSDTSVIRNKLTLNNSILDLTYATLIFEKRSELEVIDGGSFRCKGANIIVKADDLKGAIAINDYGDEVDRIIIDTDSPASTVKLGTDMELRVELGLLKGKLDVQNNKLTMKPGAVISGASPESYVIATDSGEMMQDVEEFNSAFYPVGTNDMYTPVIIEGKAGHTKGQTRVGVRGEVLNYAVHGYNISNTKPVVGITWMMGTNSNKRNADVTVSWPVAAEKNGFDRNACFVSANYGGWDSVIASAAMPHATIAGYYSQTRNNSDQLYAFTVFDNSGAVGVENVTVKESIRIYPNPVRDVLHVQAAGTMQVYNMTGQMVLQANLQQGDNAIDVSNLPGGAYQMVVNGEEVYKLRFVKQ